MRVFEMCLAEVGEDVISFIMVPKTLETACSYADAKNSLDFASCETLSLVLLEGSSL